MARGQEGSLNFFWLIPKNSICPPHSVFSPVCLWHVLLRDIDMTRFCDVCLEYELKAENHFVLFAIRLGNAKT